MGSFRVRLVTYFLLLSLLPLAASSWAFSEVAERGELSRTDSRLNTALRVAGADYAERVREDAAETASSLAHATRVQRDLATRNRAGLVRVAREVPSAVFYANGRRLAGELPEGPSVQRSARVVSPDGEPLGAVVVFVPLDDELLRELSSGSGLERGDRLVLASGGRVIAGPAGLVGATDLPGARARYVSLGGTSFRGTSADVVAGPPAVALVALTPKAEIDAAVAELRLRFLLLALLALLMVAAVAYVLGRTIVRSLKELADATAAVARGHFERRVPVKGRDELAALGRTFNEMAAELAARRAELEAERGRVRDAVARFGEALAATHDPSLLLTVIVESTVEATGAAAGRLVVAGKETASAGTPDAGGTPVTIPLGPEGTHDTVLVLTPAGEELDEAARQLAHWLAAQAAVALENLRLHRLVERQAATDGLTDLFNRRRFEEALATEISRTERFGGTLALILADLDDFKQVNDRHGHQAGDDVLRAFADVLRRSVRDVDVPARYGGEEFAVLLPETDAAGAEELAERLRRHVAARPLVLGADEAVAVTASFGVASFPEAPTSEALFAAADEALYRAKSAGKNCVVCADAGEAVRAAH